MTGGGVVLASPSAAMDGGFTAVADMSSAMASAETTEHHRLIGGVAVMLHVQRLGLDLPLRATGDADFGVPLTSSGNRGSSMRSRHSATRRSPATGGSDRAWWQLLIWPFASFLGTPAGRDVYAGAFVPYLR